MLAQSRPSGHIAAMTAQLPYATLQKIFQTFQAANAAPEGELHHTNAYTLLVAVALSAQATDVGVNKATKALFFSQVATGVSPKTLLNTGHCFKSGVKCVGEANRLADDVMAVTSIQ